MQTGARSASDTPLTPAPVTLAIASSRRGECARLLVHWDARDPPWDAGAVHPLEQQLLSLVYSLATPRIPDIRSGDAAAKLLRTALQIGTGAVRPEAAPPHPRESA